MLTYGLYLLKDTLKDIKCEKERSYCDSPLLLKDIKKKVAKAKLRAGWHKDPDIRVRETVSQWERCHTAAFYCSYQTMWHVSTAVTLHSPL